MEFGFLWIGIVTSAEGLNAESMKPSSVQIRYLEVSAGRIPLTGTAS
jgi:hypothetical protein